MRRNRKREHWIKEESRKTVSCYRYSIQQGTDITDKEVIGYGRKEEKIQFFGKN